jgi:hypothetical protein
VNWLDWKLRFYTQEVLNWGGLKFGWTKKGLMKHLIIVNVAAAFTMIGDAFWEGYYLFGIIFGVLLLLVKIVWLVPCWIYTEKQAGPETVWEFTRFFRWILLPLSALSIFIGIMGIFIGTGKISDWFNDLENFSYLAIFYIGSCINPPPKKKKEVRKVAPAFGRA